MAAVSFAVVSSRRGAHWQLTPAEAQSFGEALSNVLKHVPMPEKQMGIAADIVALGFTAFVIVAPRLEMDKAVLNAASSKPDPSTVPFAERQQYPSTGDAFAGVAASPAA